MLVSIIYASQERKARLNYSHLLFVTTFAKIFVHV